MTRPPSIPRTSTGPSAKAAPSRWRRLPEERPAHILSAALECFVQKGFAATRLDDVAQRAGVSKGTLYLYFDSKEALLEAVVRENVVPFVERAERRVDEFQGSSRDLLVEVAHGWWDAMYESPIGGLPKLVLSEASNFPDVARMYYDEVVQRVRRVFARVLRRGVESGEFRTMDVEYTVRALMAPFVVGAIWKHSMIKCQIDALDARRYLDTVLDLGLHGVLKHPADRHE